MTKPFTWNSRLYESIAVIQRIAGVELLEELGILVPEKSPGQALARYRSILDVGCGTGALAIFLASHLSRGLVLGTDVSSSMIEKAKEHAAPTGLNNLRFEEINALSLDFDGEFDLIISNMVFHWIHDAVGLLKRIRQALKPGGTLAVQFPLVNEEHLLVATMNRAIERTGLQAYYRDWQFPWLRTSAEAYGKLLEQAGFAEVSVKVRHDEYALTKEEFFRFYGAVGMSLYYAPLGEAEAAQLEASCETILEEYLKGSENKVRFVRLLAFARRPEDGVNA